MDEFGIRTGGRGDPAHHKFLLKGVLFLKHALMIPSDEALEMSRPLSRRCRSPSEAGGNP